MTLIFYVNNQALTLSPVSQNIKVVADSNNYLKAKFVFQTNDWKNTLPKFALFTYNGHSYKKYLGIEENVEENECFVAPEVIQAGEFSVSVFIDGYITTNIVNIPVAASGYTKTIENQPATPSVLEQMEKVMYNYANLCNEILKECERIRDEIK